MDTIIKIYLTMIMIASVLIIIISIIKLYTVIHHGKLIIKAKKSRLSAICWVVGIIFWVLMIIAWGILGYLNYRDNTYTNILRDILWMKFQFLIR